MEDPIESLSEETGPSKMQIKLLIERIRVIENQQATLGSEFQDLEKKQLESAKLQELKVSNFLTELEGIRAIQPELMDLTEKTKSIPSLKADLEAINDQINVIKTHCSVIEASTKEFVQNQNIEILNNSKMFQEKIEELKQVQNELKSNLLEIQDNINELKLFQENPNPIFEVFERRVANLEKHVGVTTGDLIGDTYDSGGVFKQLVTELVDKEYASSLLTDETITNQVLTVRAIKQIIMKIAGMDAARIPDITEILLRHASSSGDQLQASDRKGLLLAFNTDVRRICEIGQAVLMDIGVKRNFTRRICQEAHTVAGKWDSEEIIKGDAGVGAVLDLFDTLEQEYLSE
ncbi:MAG: hypothetical protein EAX86_10190 [Candidatus Heimdallarchaeota archaeon]|nr:hypothetical protein [Candidatus Heimdallarchaeota archaeon]